MNPTDPALEVVQAVYAAFGRGDIAAILDHVADDIEWTFHGARGLPYTGTFHGRERIAGWFRSIAEVDEILAFEPREFISGGGHVTVLGWERTRAVPGGKVFETEWVHVFTVRDGRIARYLGIYDTEASADARR